MVVLSDIIENVSNDIILNNEKSKKNVKFVVLTIFTKKVFAMVNNAISVLIVKHILPQKT